jgi:TRAP-type C4-dicarboxylate transport system permease small subunit
MPETVQKVVRKLVDLLVASFGMVMVVYGYKLASFTMTSTLPATKLPTGYLYMVMPIAGVLIAYDSIMDLLGIDKIEDPEEEQVNLFASTEEEV